MRLHGPCERVGAFAGVRPAIAHRFLWRKLRTLPVPIGWGEPLAGFFFASEPALGIDTVGHTVLKLPRETCRLALASGA